MGYGDCIVTRLGDRVRVDQADDHIRVSRQLLDDDPRVMLVTGSHMMIDAVNGRYVYRLRYAEADGYSVPADPVYAD